MKVIYDHQIFTLQRFGGISRYFYEIIKRGIADKEMDVQLSLLLSNNEYLDRENFPKVRPYFPNHDFKGKNFSMHLFNRMNTLGKLKFAKKDVFHPTYYHPYFLDKMGKVPFVVTFLDMIHEKFSARFPELGQDDTMFRYKKMLLENAAAVIAISECTKRDMMSIFGVDGAKIKVIYLGSSFDNSSVSTERVHGGPYILFVGNRGHYKNFEFTLPVFKALVDKHPDLSYVCAGGGNFTPQEKQAIAAYGLEGKIHYYGINDQILANLYSYAELFLFPSLYEGFGIPVLEAFACGCPCVMSSGGSLPEVGRDAARYFDPENVDEAIIVINEVLESDAERTRLRQAGARQLSQFSWDNTYEETKLLYKSIK
jgi:glycosyltransferase involved in cell wall biosynthesis